MCHNVFHMWPKTTCLLPVWLKDTKSLDTPEMNRLNCTSEYISQGIEISVSERYLCTLVHSSNIYYS